MIKGIKILAGVLGGFGVVGVINNYNWTTSGQLGALIISTLFSITALTLWIFIGIQDSNKDTKRKSKISNS